MSEQPRPSPFLTPSFLKPWASSFSDEVRVGIWNDRGLILFHRTPECWELLGGEDVADRLDGLSLDPEFWKSLRSEVREWGTPVVFPNLAPDAQALIHTEPSDLIETTDCSPWVSLEGGFEDYLKRLSRKPRHELKRKMAKAEREAQGGLRMESGLEYVDTFLELHRLSSPDKEAFMDDRNERFFRDLCRSLKDTDMLGLQVLFDGKTPIASILEIHFCGVAHLYNSGYNPDYRALSPGLVLIGKSIQRACESGFSEYDFLRGDERYKYHLGGENRDVFRLTWRSA